MQAQTVEHRWRRVGRGAPAGFTLIELMVVILIITILLGLLLPAIQGVRTRARIVQVQAEIQSLQSAITTFSQEFGGAEIPGEITLWATEAGWNSPAGQRDRAIIRKLWPQFNFTNCGGASWVAANPGLNLHLNGAECLVFFLGGVPDANPTLPTLSGFSKNPTTPFDRAASNRIGPFFSFDSTRLVDKDGDNVVEFVDQIPSQKSPYLYFSSNGGRGYRTELGTGTNWCNSDLWDDPNQAEGTAAWANDRRWMKYCYYSAFNVALPTAAARRQNSTAYNKTKYQIISPGFGGVGASSPREAYGEGKLFNASNPGNSLATLYDEDNITNFHTSGTLSGR